MKTIKWENDDKMLFESKHKTFNKQCRLISVGNQLGDVVYSNYIRAYNETECNGNKYQPGELQDYDLTKNMVGKDLPDYVREEIREILGKDKTGIVYHFHHWIKGYSRRIDDGIVLTTAKDFETGKNPKLLKVWYLNRDWRAQDAVNEAIKYIAD